MPIYRNVTMSDVSFHGITFKPGECKEVDFCINSNTVVRLNSSVLEESTVRTSSQVEEAKPKRSYRKRQATEPAVENVSVQEDSNVEANPVLVENVESTVSKCDNPECL